MTALIVTVNSQHQYPHQGGDIIFRLHAERAARTMYLELQKRWASRLTALDRLGVDVYAR